MHELFRAEAEKQLGVLTNGLLELERSQAPAQTLETLMRAAHSLKGAARIVELHSAVTVAHAMEDCFVAAQQGVLRLRQAETDLLLQGVDLLTQLAKRPEADLAQWQKETAPHIERFLVSIGSLTRQGKRIPDYPASANPPPASFLPAQGISPLAAPATVTPPQDATSAAEAAVQAFSYRRPEPPERILRLTAENLNRLLGLAGESLVESRWLRPFTDSLQRLKRSQVDIGLQVAALRSTLEEQPLPERVRTHFQELNRQLSDARGYLVDRIKELETYDRRSAQLSHRLYLEVLRTRMRPFGEGVRRFPRMVRDLARSLGKEVKLEIFGESTPVDRDILECLEAPLAHLMHNAVDHGCETPELRERAGKPAENVVRLEARHSAGVLLITVTDDGAGVDIEQVRKAVVEKRMVQPDAAAKLSEADLLEFLFLPGFSLRDEVTEISGRGVGLDLVQTMVKSVRGTIRVSNQPGRGLRIQLHLPLTLSVLRTLLVEVGGEPYAIPLSQMARAARIPRAEIQNLEGKPTFQLGDQRLALLASHQILDYPLPPVTPEDLPVVVLGERNTRFGLAVDRFLGERELVVQPLDKRLGKVTGISAAAFMEDGSPVLIVDVEDLVRSMEKLVADGLPAGILRGSLDQPGQRRKRILVADDSLTVREMQRKLLARAGYAADVAADGIEAWNAIRHGGYDLLISDVDMPRMDGFQLTALIKRDPNLKSVPVLIISYKDREDDRLRGLDAGADYYLTKGSFDDKLLVQAVTDLIGEPGT